MIYVAYNSELKNVILREFHVKPYSGHPGYQKTLTAVKRFYYWLNLKSDVAEFVDRFLIVNEWRQSVNIQMDCYS